MDPNDELQRRDAMWAALLEIAPDRCVTTAQLGVIGIRPANTGHGIFRDQEHTSALAPEGVTLSLLDTGTTYPDAFDDDAGEYHYPATERGSRDENEIAATRNARRFDLPVFVVLAGPKPSLREVRRGWVERWDDDRRVFLISFRNAPAQGPIAPPAEAPFVLNAGERLRRTTLVRARPGQNRFRFAVLERCGSECVVCGLRVDILVDAAHVCAVEHGGTDDPRNGLALCRNHHRAFDGPDALFGIKPDSLEIVPRTRLGLEEIGITRSRLSPAHAPHPDAVAWAWSRFTE